MKQNFFYQYHERPPDFQNYYCLDFNEYQGEIANSTAQVLKNSELIRYYPRVNDCECLVKLSQFFKIPKKYIFLTCGADEALFHILLLKKLKWQYNTARLFFYPTYDHAIHFMKVLGFQILKPQSLESFKIVYISFPNNPTGEEISPLELEEAVKKDKKIFWILDMTYIFYSRYKTEDYKNIILSNKNVAAVLSFSKAFPLAGLRMACVLSTNSLVMEYFQKDYNKKTIGSMARAVALDCLQNRDFYQEQQHQIKKNKATLASLFEKIAHKQQLKLKSASIEGGGNFFCMKGSLKEREKFSHFLYARKIIIRQKKTWDFLRVTSVCDKLLEAVKNQIIL